MYRGGLCPILVAALRVCNAIPIWLLGDAKLAAKELAANPPWRRAFRT